MFEGTSDYLLHKFTLQTTYEASGSITAGDPLEFLHDGTVRKASSGSKFFAGVAVMSAADTEKLGAIAWGPVKNIVAAIAVDESNWIQTAENGNFFVVSETDWHWAETGSALKVGMALSAAASGSKFNAYIHAQGL